MANVSIRTFLKNFDAGMYDSTATSVQCDAGWYDWFCKDTSLVNKTKSLTKKLKQIVRSPKINQDTMYVWFKNNCPVNGRLYDDFRIADLATDNTLFCVVPSVGHIPKQGQSEVYDVVLNQYTVEGTWKDVLQFFNAT